MKKISRLIFELETKCNPEKILVSHKGLDYEVYPWIKPFLFSALQTGNKSNSRDTSIWFQLKQIFSGWSLFFRRYKTIIISNSLERRFLDGQVYDKLFHYISNKNSMQPCLTIESKFPSNHYPLHDYKNKICTSRSIFFLRELLYRLIFLRKISIKEANVLNEFIEEQGVQVNLNYAIKKNIAQYKVMYRFFKRRPEIKYVFLTVSYTNFGLIKACKELGIKVVEVQHGVINSEHYGYSYHYTPNQNQFPNYLLTLGDADCDFFHNNPLNNILQVKSVGSFIIEYYLNQDKSISTTQSYTSKVVVSLQDCETGISAVSTFIELAERNPNIAFYFKRRRTRLEEYLNKFKFPKNVFFEKDRSIYELIRDCDIHLTAYSSCALEAPSLGVRNILYNHNDKAKQYYLDKLPEGSLNSYCSSLEEIHLALNKFLLKNVSQDYVKQSNNHNIKSDYSNNIDSFIENHILNEV